VRNSSSLPAEKAHPTTRYPVIKVCAWLGLSAYGSYDHHNSVEAHRAQRRAKIIIPVRAAYRAGRGTHGVRDHHDIEFRRWLFLTARVATAGPAALVSLLAAALAVCAARLTVDALTRLGNDSDAALDHRRKSRGWSASAVDTRRARPCPPARVRFRRSRRASPPGVLQ
jgi:hypothetical protein